MVDLKNVPSFESSFDNRCFRNENIDQNERHFIVSIWIALKKGDDNDKQKQDDRMNAFFLICKIQMKMNEKYDSHMSVV